MAEQINIGTATAPLMVSKGSAAYENYLKQQAEKGAKKSSTSAKKTTQQTQQNGKPSDMEEWEQQTQTTIEDIQSQIPDIQAGLEDIASGQGETGTPPTEPIDGGEAQTTGEGAKGGAQTRLQQLEDLTNQLQEQYSQSQQQIEEKTSLIEKLMGQKKDVRESQESPQELYKQARQTALSDMGLTESDIQQIGSLIEEVTEYNKQITDIKAEKQQALISEEQAGMPQTYIQGRKALTERLYNSRISAKAAEASVKSQKLQMLQGAYKDAKQTASQIVDYKTYDQRQRVKDIEWQIEMNADLLDMATTQEKQAWNRLYTTAQDELDREKTRTEYVNGLMVDAKGEAGITLDDTREEATRKYNEWQQTQPDTEDQTAYKELYNEATSAGYEGTFTDFLKERGILEETEKRESTDDQLRAQIQEWVAQAEDKAKEQAEDVGEDWRQYMMSDDKLYSVLKRKILLSNANEQDRERMELLLDERFGKTPQDTEEDTEGTTESGESGDIYFGLPTNFETE